MKKYLVILFMLSLIQLVHAQTQAEMNKKAWDDFAKADQKLNDVYKKILFVYADNKQFIKKLKTAQVAWIKFRDAHLESVYSASNQQVEYGSMFPMCYSMEEQIITEARIKQLEQWLNGVEEGDTCSGSRMRPADVQERLKNYKK